jgi:hypothetical protein
VHTAHSTGTQACAALAHRAKTRSARTARVRTGRAGGACLPCSCSAWVYLRGRGNAAAHQCGATAPGKRVAEFFFFRVYECVCGIHELPRTLPVDTQRIPSDVAPVPVRRARFSSSPAGMGVLVRVHDGARALCAAPGLRAPAPARRALEPATRTPAAHAGCLQHPGPRRQA